MKSTKFYGPRFREQRRMLVPMQYHQIDYGPTGSLQSDVTFVGSNTFGTGTYDSISDVVTPDYFTSVKAGAVILNSATFVHKEIVCDDGPLVFGFYPGWGTRRFTGKMAAIWGHSGVRPSWFQADVISASNLVLTRAYAKMNEADFQLLVSIGEFHKTVSLIESGLNDMVRITTTFASQLRSIRRRFRKITSNGQLVDMRRELSQRWLEYRYGWKPLMFDIENATKAYSNLVSSKPTRRQVSRASEEFEYEYSGTDASNRTGLTSCSIGYRHRYTAKVSAGVIWELTDETPAQDYLHRLGLYWRDIPSVAWELVPYSFVVDWFVNVGDWLNAALPNPNVAVLGNWVTTQNVEVSTNVITRATISVAANPPYPATVLTSGGQGSIYLERSLNRQANVQRSLLPAFTTRDLGLLRSIDGVLLLCQQLTNLKKLKLTTD